MICALTYILTVNGCTYPPDNVIVEGSSSPQISIVDTVAAEGYGESFMSLNDTMTIKCRNGMRMSPNLTMSTRTITCSTNNTWIIDTSFKCVTSECLINLCLRLQNVI